MESAGDTDKSVAEWIRSAAIPIATVEPRHGLTDLEPLRAIVGDARILSLGEATHGTREFFKLKHRAVEFCVAELGFTLFIIEANFPETLAVNAYVLDGVGTAADALAGMRFWIWNTEEVLDLIEWMRWWNANNPRKVKFYGFTMSYPAIAALGLIDFLERCDPALAAHCKTELAPLTSDFTAGLFGQLPGTRRDSILGCIARVLAAFTQQRSGWVAATSDLDWHLGRLHATVLDQGARTDACYERSAAANVIALLEAEGPTARAILWSHNDHAMRDRYEDGNSMGEYLDELAGPAQVVVGMSFDRGAFTARDYPTGELIEHTIEAATPGSFDAVLAQSGPPLFALDLAHAPREGRVAEWLLSEISMRKIGGIYGLQKDNKYGAAYTATITPRKHFDAILFVAETTAARQNRRVVLGPNSDALPAPSNLELSGVGIPSDWRQPGAGRRHAHVVALSAELSPRGGRTVCISRDAPWRWGQGQLVQKISVQAWRGKRLRFSAAIRTQTGDVGAGALLSLSFQPKPDSGVSDFYLESLATIASAAEPAQSPQWTSFTVEADVPEAADSFAIGLVMTGNGAVWFGDLELAVIDGNQ